MGTFTEGEESSTVGSSLIVESRAHPCQWKEANARKKGDKEMGGDTGDDMIRSDSFRRSPSSPPHPLISFGPDNMLTRTHSLHFCVIAVAMTMNVAVVRADEKLAGIACRSVHWGYPGPAATAFYNEVTIDESAAGTYFCVCGFNKGYYGLQELADGKHLLIFSVWDPGAERSERGEERAAREATASRQSGARRPVRR